MRFAITILFIWVSLQITVTGDRFLPSGLISFLAAVHPQLCRCQGWEDTQTVLWKEGYYIAPPLRNIRQEVKGEGPGRETCRGAVISSPRYFNQHSFTPACMHLDPLNKLPPNLICLLGKYWSRRDLPPDNCHTNQGLHGQWKEGRAKTRVGNVTDERAANEDTICETFVSQKAELGVGNWELRLRGFCLRGRFWFPHQS